MADKSTTISPEESPAPDIGFLGVRGSRAMIYARADAEIAQPHLLGHGDFEPIPAEEALEGVNLFADSGFAGASVHWRSHDSSRKLETVEAEDHLLSVAPSARRALALTVTRAEPGDSARYFIVYEDPRWGRRIPVAPAAEYGFSLRAHSRHCGIGMRVEFHDAAGKRIPSATVDARMPANTITNVLDAEFTVEATAPPGAATMSCVLVVAANGEMPVGENADAHLGEPMLWRGERESPKSWRPRPEPFDGYYALIEDEDARAFAADLNREGLVADSSGLTVVDAGEDVPLARLELAGLGADSAAVGQLSGLDGKTLVARVKLYTGNVQLLVDGENVGTAHVAAGPTPKPIYFAVPDIFFDGEAHLVELVDDTMIRSLAIDYVLMPTMLTPWSAMAKYSKPPLPGELDKKAGARMRAMRAHLDGFSRKGELDDQDRWLLANLRAIGDALTAGFEENRDVFALRFPEVAAPVVSVIVPVHNKYPVTFICLCSLLFGRNETPFEVIIADDGSTDETEDELALHEGITVVRNASAQGFIGACKAGAEKARGEYLLFLNNDVEVTAGWLDELVRVFDIFPGTGAACSKLVFPDGLLQDAGGIVWKNGSPWNYGRRQNPADPRFSYSRAADYLTGAALITPRAVWDEIGGFADELRPAYYEDTWYSFAVRDLNLKTIYCATSIVYHVQGVSNGVDVNTETGLKRFQKINEPKFKRRWALAYRDHGAMGLDPDLEKDRGARGRALVLDWAVPRPDQDAGSFAAIQEMRMLQALGYKVTFLPINLANLGNYNVDLNRLGIETVTAPFTTGVAEFLGRRGAEFDLVLANRHHVGGPIVELVRELAPDARLILNVADLHFLREMRRALLTGDKKLEADTHQMREHELSVMRRFDLVLSYSDFEVGLMTALLGSEAKIDRLPWVQPVEVSEASPEGREGLCFLGSYNHPPNKEAVDFFEKSILQRLPDAVLHVYGSSWPTDGSLEYGDQVVIDGFIDDLGEMFARHRVCVVPLQSGAGVKGKVLMAMAHGIPQVLSPVAAEAINVIDGENCLIAETNEQWVDAISRLEADDALWSELSRGGLDFIEKTYSFEAGTAQLARALEKLDIFV